MLGGDFNGFILFLKKKSSGSWRFTIPKEKCKIKTLSLGKYETPPPQKTRLYTSNRSGNL